MIMIRDIIHCHSKTEAASDYFSCVYLCPRGNFYFYFFFFFKKKKKIREPPYHIVKVVKSCVLRWQKIISIIIILCSLVIQYYSISSN
jgi:hypothetical protein